MARFEVQGEASTLILGRLAACMLHLGRLDPINSLIDVLLKRAIHDPDEEEVILEIGRTFHKMAYYNSGLIFIEKVLDLDIFERNPDALFLYALFEQAKGNQSKALDLYQLILEIQPSYVNARINLSTILQNSGHADAALQSLMDHDLDLCAQLPVTYCTLYTSKPFRMSVF
jgi:tetratricopeptide (TPR) repeat protein